MRFGCLITLVAAGSSFASGYAQWPIVWAILAALLAGALFMGNGPSYELVERANREGRLSVLPMMWALNSLGPLVVSTVFWFVGRLVA